MLERIKQRCGIAYGVVAYDIEIEDYISECIQDLISSGVPENIAKSDNPAVITAITLYVKALIGDDRTDTQKYLELYRQKVFRLTLEGE